MIDSTVEDLDACMKKIGESKDSKDTKTSENIAEAEDLIKQLRIDLTAVSDKKKKADIQEKIKTSEAVIASRKKESLFAGASKPAQSSKLEKSQESLRILEESHKTLAETEQVGANILENLNKQKETMIHAHNNLKNMNNKLKEGDGLLNQMSKWWRG